LGKAEAQEGRMTTIWIYAGYRAGHPDHLKVFINPVAADESLNENDPDGAAFDYEVLK
jgi:hypothetical protein